MSSANVTKFAMSSGAQLEGGGGGLPCLFSKIGKKCPNFGGENAVVVVIYGLNFSFKVQFLRFSKREKPEIFPCRAFLSRVPDDYLLKCPYSNKTTLP